MSDSCARGRCANAGASAGCWCRRCQLAVRTFLLTLIPIVDFGWSRWMFLSFQSKHAVLSSWNAASLPFFGRVDTSQDSIWNILSWLGIL